MNLFKLMEMSVLPVSPSFSFSFSDLQKSSFENATYCDPHKGFEAPLNFDPTAPALY